MCVSDLGVKAAGALLAVVAVACCVHGISSVTTTQDATVMDASGGIGLTADPTLCRVIAFSPNPPFHPDTALEPHISAKTVDHHYRAHQKGYVVKLNTWIASTPASGVSTEHIKKDMLSSLTRG
ncbi:iron superoxide dismutase, putative [Bodo saltans]|uniref:superoxide dismutase n=1 Tax=Bodo saltans TaxID=75058 RepID=A0A0S4J6L5_BODSA|nr:iron superoxide dismutase, putative [Bodo saltans]|eukprot:CUG87106.1 iron superoxide dismutase, putative [Bodo saltans]